MSREITRDAEMAEALGSVAREVQLEHDVLVDAERFEHGRPERQVGRQDPDAGVVVAHAELAGAAQHAVRPLAAHLRALDVAPVGHDRADGGERHEVARLHVEGSTADLQALAVTTIDEHDADAIRVRVLRALEHLRDHDTVDRGADARERLDGHAELREHDADRVCVGAERGEVVEPGQEHVHQNCSRNRRSLVNISRRSSTPLNSRAMRSMPKPNAKPV